MSDFDWKKLQTLIREGARNAFTEVRNQHPGEELFGYCLYSDDGARTIAHAVGKAENNRPAQEDDEYWNPHEWELQEGLEHLAPAQKLLQSYSETVSEEDYADYCENVFKTAVAALEELRSEGFFATNNDDPYILFSVADWSEQDVLPWVKQLNSSQIINAYKHWMEEQYRED